MLAYTLSVIPETTLNKFLKSPDIRDNQFHTRSKGETNMFICDVDLQLSEELKIYLFYFSSTADKNISHSLKSFSNLPIKEV